MALRVPFVNGALSKPYFTVKADLNFYGITMFWATLVSENIVFAFECLLSLHANKHAWSARRVGYFHLWFTIQPSKLLFISNCTANP